MRVKGKYLVLMVAFVIGYIALTVGTAVVMTYIANEVNCTEIEQ